MLSQSSLGYNTQPIKVNLVFTFLLSKKNRKNGV
jgi:hypothetical protein